jgi:hypothetical protein
MKTFLALLVGALIGVAVFWYYQTTQGKSVARATGQKIEDAAGSARDAIQDKLKSLNLSSDEIKDELAKTGKVVRRKAQAAGDAIADATADARITGAIKAKLVASRELSVLSISVNTTTGVVTLSGSVNTPEDISRAMLLAMETDGVHEVVSSLQVKK